jgi:hypothetical protein
MATHSRRTTMNEIRRVHHAAHRPLLRSNKNYVLLAWTNVLLVS